MGESSVGHLIISFRNWTNHWVHHFLIEASTNYLHDVTLIEISYAFISILCKKKMMKRFIFFVDFLFFIWFINFVQFSMPSHMHRESNHMEIWSMPMLKSVNAMFILDLRWEWRILYYVSCTKRTWAFKLSSMRTFEKLSHHFSHYWQCYFKYEKHYYTDIPF